MNLRDYDKHVLVRRHNALRKIGGIKMSQSVTRVPFTEQNNQKQGKSGSSTPKKPGPAKGNRGHVNPTKSGGIYRATKSN